MGNTISSFGINALVQEIKEALKEAYFEKAQQVGLELFKFSFRTRRGKRELLIEVGKRLNLTSYAMPAPKTASNMAMILRKHLRGKKLRSVEQYDFDRVVTFDFGDAKLIGEFFSHGNLILTDADFNVLFAFRQEEWKDRKIQRKQHYEYPKPSGYDPKTITAPQFAKIFDQDDAVRSIAKHLRIGGEHAEEICVLAGVDKNTRPSPAEIKKLFHALRGLMEYEIRPVLQGGAVRPFPLAMPIDKTYDTMNQAVDEFFVGPKRSVKLEKLERRLEKQLSTLREYGEKSAQEREIGDLVYKHYAKIEEQMKKKKTKFVVDLD
jgi:predicted ribosome quality control (RQC) complex YloA/Tae2 family protein